LGSSKKNGNRSEGAGNLDDKLLKNQSQVFKPVPAVPKQNQRRILEEESKAAAEYREGAEKEENK